MSGLMQKFHFANICGTVPPKELLKKCCLDIYQTGKKSVWIFKNSSKGRYLYIFAATVDKIKPGDINQQRDRVQNHTASDAL